MDGLGLVCVCVGWGGGGGGGGGLQYFTDLVHYNPRAIQNFDFKMNTK